MMVHIPKDNDHQECWVSDLQIPCVSMTQYGGDTCCVIIGNDRREFRSVEKGKEFRDYLLNQLNRGHTFPRHAHAMPQETSLESELAELLNRHSVENASNTPDYILAEYLTDCLDAFDKAVRARTAWGNPPKVPTTLHDPGTPPDLV